MGLFIYTFLVTLAVIAVMLTWQAQALESGRVEVEHRVILHAFRPHIALAWQKSVEWLIAVRKEISRHLALVLAKAAHSVGGPVRKLILMLHRHGRHQ